MIKKTFLGFSFALMVFVLAGCVSIPIGDSVLEISTDGVDFVSGNNDNANNDDLFDMNDNNFNNNNNDEVDQSNSSNGDDLMTASSSFCDSTEDHSFFTQYVNDDFYIPECAKLTDVNNSDSQVKGDFKIEGAKWEEVYNAYKDEHEEQFTSEDVKIDKETVFLKIGLTKETSANIDIYQKEDGVDLYVRYRK